MAEFDDPTQAGNDPAPSNRSSHQTRVAAVVAAGVVAGVVLGQVLPLTGSLFKIPEEIMKIPGPPYSPENQLKVDNANLEVQVKNSGAQSAIVGAVFGLVLGAAGGWLRRPAAAGLGAVIGLTAGGLFGGAGGVADAFIYQALFNRRIVHPDYDVFLRTSMAHACVWGLTSLAVSLALWPAAGRKGKYLQLLAVNLLSALIWAFAFPFLAAVLAIVGLLGQSEVPIPSPQLMATLWCTGAGAIFGLASARILTAVEAPAAPDDPGT